MSCCIGDSNSRGSEFEPTADMMVHDYDDERTLEEEEALDGDEDSQSELASLQKVSAYYMYLFTC